MEDLTQFEREVLAQALTDYDEGISESDLPREDPELFDKLQASLNEIERKMLFSKACGLTVEGKLADY